MATTLYKYDPVKKGIIEEKFEGSDVGNLIANGGWVADLNDVNTAHDDTLELIPSNLNLDKFENDDIREFARAAGIEGYDKKRISTLKKELS